jgi:hypothetical protein
MINYFSSINCSSTVLGNITIDEFLNTIKEGNDSLDHIKEARLYYSDDKTTYKHIKTTKLPAYALNFTFNGVRRNNAISNSTGYIYLDVDGNTDIDTSNPLIFATWLSLSGTGRGILVQTKNINLQNFVYSYDAITKELGINSDIGARKPTQINVLSYDPDLYTNYESKVWEYIEEEIVSKKDQYTKYIGVSVDNVMGEKQKVLRFNNLDEVMLTLDFKGRDFIYSFKGIKYAEAFLPFVIRNGERNTILTAYLIQLRALNLNISYATLLKTANSVNENRCLQKLPQDEIKEIVKYVMKLIGLTPNFNKIRKIVINPTFKGNAKTLTVNVVNKVIRRNNSRRKIQSKIDNWDFESNGRITQRALAKTIPMNIKTIGDYAEEFEQQIKEKNDVFKRDKDELNLLSKRPINRP